MGQLVQLPRRVWGLLHTHEGQQEPVKFRGVPLEEGKGLRGESPLEPPLSVEHENPNCWGMNLIGTNKR